MPYEEVNFIVVDGAYVPHDVTVKGPAGITPLAVYNALNVPMKGLDRTRHHPINEQGMLLPLERVSYAKA